MLTFRSLRISFYAVLDQVSKNQDVSNVISDAINPLNSTPSYAFKFAGSKANQIDRTQPPTTEGMLHAVYTEMKSESKKSNNIIISGLRPDPQLNDATIVCSLLEENLDVLFDLKSSIKSPRRIGKPDKNGFQRLLVTLQNEHVTSAIKNQAKYLRSSRDDHIASHVYINADLTSTEAKIAFEHRVLRRKRELKKPGIEDRDGDNIIGTLA